MNNGKVFENDIKDSVDSIDQVYYYRLKDSASSFNSGKGSRFTPKNDYDCLMYMYPNYFPMELKSTKGTSFSIQLDKKEKSKMIKLHQIEGLRKASWVKGVYAGFLFNFSDKKRTYWMNIKDFDKFLAKTTKKSINETDIIEYGGILVQQELKRVRYRYLILSLLRKIQNKY